MVAFNSSLIFSTFSVAFELQPLEESHQRLSRVLLTSETNSFTESENVFVAEYVHHLNFVT
jgi:hypothetical protein